MVPPILGCVRRSADLENVSKHLQLLHTMGFVRRRKDGLFVYYALADKGIFQLCDTMCGRLEREMKRRRKLLAG
jgi:ArsR family transcriptional regulator